MPITFGTVHQFNTGRLYSAAGQPIAWATYQDPDTDTHGIVMKDSGRGISNCYPLPGEPGINTYEGRNTPHTMTGDLDNSYVLRCYDACFRHAKPSYQVEWAFANHLRSIQ